MPETMSPNKYSFSGYDGSHVKMGRKPNTADLALSDEQLKNKRKMSISMNVSDLNVHIQILQTTFKRHLNQMLHVLKQPYLNTSERDVSRVEENTLS